MNKTSGLEWHYRDTVAVACANLTPVDGDKTASLKKIKDFVAKAAEQGANIIALPEIILGNIVIPREVEARKVELDSFPPPSLFDLAETIPGPSTEEIARLAARHKVYVIFGLVEVDGGEYYNSGAVIGPEGILGAHRKTHVRSPWETAWFSKGKSLPLFKTPYGPIGIGICFETFCMPEIARSYALRGARLFINLTAQPRFPDCRDYEEFYMTTLGSRAIENQMFVASADIVGDTRGLNHIGYSVILGPKPGYMSYQVFAGPASETDEELIIATLDLRSIEKTPFAVVDVLKDRRPEVFRDLVFPSA